MFPAAQCAKVTGVSLKASKALRGGLSLRARILNEIKAPGAPTMNSTRPTRHQYAAATSPNTNTAARHSSEIRK